jgi:flagellar hook-length control protein FliK
LTAQPGQPAPTEELVLHIAARSARGDSRFTIRLDPPELGRIEVNLSVTSHGHAQAALAADKPQTLELLQRDASVLERTLKEAGVDVGGNLSFSLKGEGRSPFARDDYSQPEGRTLEMVARDTVAAHSLPSGVVLDQLYGVASARLDITV